jgi:S-formylglutathione hydrolase FrmB
MIGSQPMENPLRRPDVEAEMRRIFGDNPIGSRHDLLSLAATCSASNQLPKLWMDCGTADFLFEDNQNFYTHMLQMGLPITYEVGDGSHDWEYWNRLLPYVLKWMGFTPAA